MQLAFHPGLPPNGLDEYFLGLDSNHQPYLLVWNIGSRNWVATSINVMDGWLTPTTFACINVDADRIKQYAILPGRLHRDRQSTPMMQGETMDAYERRRRLHRDWQSTPMMQGETMDAYERRIGTKR